MSKYRDAVFWILLVLELYIVILIASYIWMNLVVEVSDERFLRWNFPSPFYLWSTPIYTWTGMAYFLTLVSLATVIGVVAYEELNRANKNKA